MCHPNAGRNSAFSMKSVAGEQRITNGSQQKCYRCLRGLRDSVQFVVERTLLGHDTEQTQDPPAHKYGTGSGSDRVVVDNKSDNRYVPT
jgi:hypothetical protein